MQGKVRKKRKTLTEKLRQRDEAKGKQMFFRLLKELGYGLAGYLFGIGTLLFESNPLGIALLMASKGHIPGLLTGLITAELVLGEKPVFMIVTYVLVAAVREILLILTELPETRVTLPPSLRKKLIGTSANRLNRRKEIASDGQTEQQGTVTTGQAEQQETVADGQAIPTGLFWSRRTKRLKKAGQVERQIPGQTAEQTVGPVTGQTAGTEPLRTDCSACEGGIFCMEAETAGTLQASSPWKKLTLPFRQFHGELCSLLSENLPLRMAAAAVGMLAVSVYRCIGGGFRYYDLFAGIFATVLAPVLVLLYAAALEGRKELKILYVLSSASLIASLVYASDDVVLGTLPVSAICAFFISLTVTELEGIGWGSAASLLCGVSFLPMQAPAYLLASLVYSGMKKQKKASAGVFLGVAVSAVWTVYINPLEAVTLLFPAHLLGGALFSIFLLHRKEEPASEEADRETMLRCATARHEDSNHRFRNISDAFSSLSEIFYNLSDRLRRPGTLDLRRICDSSFDAYCSDCPNKTVCWGLEYSDTLGVMNQLISHLHTKGKVNSEQIPPHLMQRCASMEHILTLINRECARFTAELLRSNRNEIFAMDYEAAANIINDALEEDDGEYRFDSEMEDLLKGYLSDAKIKAESISVYGKRRRQILLHGVDLDRAAVTLETLRSDLSELSGLQLSKPTFEVENNCSTMLLQAERKLSVLGSEKNLSRGEGASGDTVNLFSNKKDYFYALICDGMGSGKEAAFTSGLCSAFLEEMLRAGNRANTSLRMLNNMIVTRCSESEEECSSTVDLMELDLISGRAAFIKSGAAPCFVVRGKRIHCLQSPTAPIGIIRKLDTQISYFDLKEGDTVVMVSDGILQDDPDGKWLTGFLTDCGEKATEEIVSAICDYASGFQNHDDCSAIALRMIAPTDD